MSTTEPIPVRRTTQRRRRDGALAVVAVTLSLVSLGLSAWTAFRPELSTSVKPDRGAGQRAEAKAAICGAVDLVRRGVAVNTNVQSPGGEGDVTGALAVAANARVSLFDGGFYLRERLDPATPAELADAVRAFADTLMDVGAAATAGALNTDPDQAARLRDADTENAKVADLCK